jgi:NitT/TauT family transport system permease protein
LAWSAQVMLGSGFTLLGLGLMLAVIVSNAANLEGWSFTALLLVYVGTALGLVGVGFVSSAVVRFLNRPREAQNRDWFVKQVVGLMPALLLALVAVVAVEGLVRGYAVPLAQIPPPSAVLQKLWEARVVLWRDTQTTLLEVFVGFVVGGALGFGTAIATQRSRFLEQGLMPYATLFSSIPIVALAPVVIKAMGVDWQSKAVVVGITVFFPILLNTARGLSEVNPLHVDLMRSYAATPGRVFSSLRIPNAMPYIFNGIKTSAVLALIAAIVAEFFGANGSGLGFRIVVEIGTSSLDTVWAAINIASLLGITVYNLLALLERRITGWHASNRSED